MDAVARFDPVLLRLIAITDSLRDGVEGLSARAVRAVAGGVTALHLRLTDESPRVLVDVARALRAAVPQVPLLVSERADVALAAGAQGVHLGIDDLPAAVLRRILPAGFLIGASVGDVADVAGCAGADYVAIGPVFGTGSRVDVGVALGIDGFRELAALTQLPAVAIGGVSTENAAALMGAGACGLAVISALFSSADPSGAARSFRFAQDASER